MLVAGSHKLLRIFAEARLDGKTIASDMIPLDAFRKAETNNHVHRIRKDTYMCAYKTEFEEKKCLIIFVTMRLPGSLSGSSLASESVMEIVSLLESILSPINYIHFDRNIENNEKNIAMLTVITEIKEDRFLDENPEN